MSISDRIVLMRAGGIVEVDTPENLYNNPKNLFTVICDQVRAYRKWEQEYERWRIDVFYEADYGVFNENAIAIQSGIIVPIQAFGS